MGIKCKVEKLLALQNTVDDVEEQLMSLAAVNIKYNVLTKSITEIGLFCSTSNTSLLAEARFLAFPGV